MKELTIQNSNLKAIVDDHNFERLSKYKWYRPNGRNAISRVVCTTVYKPSYKKMSVHISLASEVMCKPGVMHDHIDRDWQNNLESNLRQVSYSINNQNRAKRVGTSSSHTGVSAYNNGKSYRVSINHLGKRYCLGTFSTELAAAKAYNEKALILYGSTAKLNIV